MLRLAIVVLVTVEILLLTAFALPSANATTANFKPHEQYIWDYVSPLSDRQVCKKVTVRPEKIVHPRNINHDALQIETTTEIVPNRLCKSQS